MIIYNVTVSIDPSIENEWTTWMKTVHIPDVLNTKLFVEARFSKILAEEDAGTSFSIMYLCESQENLTIYQKEHAPILQKEHSEKFAGKFAAFRTHLAVIETFKNEG